MPLKFCRKCKMQCLTTKFSCILICLCFIPRLLAKKKESKERLNPGTENDDMGLMDKKKMMTLSEELIKDTKLKERQVQHIREIHRDMTGYEVGLIMGKIREKYKRMLEIYRESKEREAHKNPYRPPAYHLYKPLIWVIDMEITRTLEVDIDKMVHILEMMPKDKNALQPVIMGEGRDIPDFIVNNPKNALRARDLSKDTGPPNSTLASEHMKNNVTTAAPKVTSKYADEEALKQHYRDEYNMRNGRDPKWSLDDYFGI